MQQAMYRGKILALFEDGRLNAFNRIQLYLVHFREGSDLSMHNFDFAQISGCRFDSRSLQDASFHRANIKGCIFQRIDLGGANFEDALISDTSLEQANLKGVDLERTRLIRVNLCGADLRGARLNVERLRSVIWDDKTLWPSSWRQSRSPEGQYLIAHSVREQGWYVLNPDRKDVSTGAKRPAQT